MTVIPLFCSRFLKSVPHADDREGANGEYELPAQPKDHSGWDRFNLAFNRTFNRVLDYYEFWVRRALQRPALTVLVLSGVFVASLGIYPLLGVAFFPQTDAGQFTINLKVPTGTRIEVTEEYIAKVEDLIRHTVKPSDLKMIVSNLGVVPDFSSLYTTNAGPYTATVQVQLQPEHSLSSFTYIDRVQKNMAQQFPDIRTFFSSGSMVDAVLSMGMPAPIDVQVSSPDLREIYGIAQDLSGKIRGLPGVGEVYIPQDLNYPALRLDVNRVHAAELGLTQKDVVDNVITALNSNYMIAPNYWVDRKSGNDYYLTVQYFENGQAAIHNMVDLGQIPLHAGEKATREPDRRPASGTQPRTTPLSVLKSVVNVDYVQTPTEVDHYQIQRVADVYVTPASEDLGKVAAEVQSVIKDLKVPENVRINLRGMVQGMNASFTSFAIGLSLSVVLLYLILVAQFRSFKDPFLIMLAIPMGFTGVLIILPLTGTTLNVMSLMGVLMLVGISASNSILIVEFAHRLEQQGKSVEQAIITSCRVRLRPILMTSLATIIGMVPLALKLGTGSEQYAPLARAIIGGLAVSVVLTVFIVPAAYLLVYRDKKVQAA
jgi:multidrug efflux pump subunit AcrB